MSGEIPEMKSNTVEDRAIELFVKETTNDYLRKKWEFSAKIAAIIGPILLAVIGFLGYRQAVAVGQISELEKKLNGTSELLSKTESNVSKVDSVLEKASANVEKSLELTQKGLDLTRSNNQSVFDSQSNMFDMQSSLQEKIYAISKIGPEAEKAKTTAEAARDAINATLEATKDKYNEMNEAKEKVDKMDQELGSKLDAVRTQAGIVEEKYNALIRNSGGLEELRALNERLARVIASESTLIQQGRSHKSFVNVPDLSDTKKELALTIAAPSIKSDKCDLEIEVNGNKLQPMLGLTRNETRPIGRTGYVVILESIYYAKLAYDFVAIKVVPNPDLPILKTKTD